MGWLLIALWLYSRGFESRSDRDLLLGSAAAACAIGTRQFGMALIAGVVVAWVVSGPASRPALRSLLWALTLPLTVSAWQLSAGLAAPNFTQAMRLHEQANFLTLPPSTMAHEIGWRLSTVLQYLGLSLLPVLPLLASLCLARAYRRDGPQIAGTTRAASSSERSSEVTAVLALLTLAGLLLFSLKNSDISTRENSGHLLPLPWMLPTAFWNKTWLMRGFAASGVVGAFFRSCSSGAGRAHALGCATCLGKRSSPWQRASAWWRFISAMYRSTTPISSASPLRSTGHRRAPSRLAPQPRGCWPSRQRGRSQCSWY